VLPESDATLPKVRKTAQPAKPIAGKNYKIRHQDFNCGEGIGSAQQAKPVLVLACSWLQSWISVLNFKAAVQGCSSRLQFKTELQG
jgi:hypothetical protein